VDIWFAQELFRRKGENTIRVTAPDGQEVSVGDTIIDDDDRTHVWVNLKPDLAAGVYQVAWKNVSLEDGHPTEGSFRFTLDPQAAATSTPMSEPTPIGQATAQPAATESATATPSAAPSVATPTKAPPSLTVCGVAVAPIVGLAAYVTLSRSRRKRF
jgi:cell division septation protein DedD